MNIECWDKALQKAGIRYKYRDVVTGFKHGFHQGIPFHRLPDLPWFTPENHLSATLAEEKIILSMKKEVMAGRMFGPFSHTEVASKFQFFRTSPLGAVVNGDGSVRPINDLSFPHGNPETPSVNSFVDKDDFITTWDDFNTVSSFFRSLKEPVKLALFDWEKAYRQIPTHPSQWPYLMVKGMDGKLYLDTRITFGGVAGVRLKSGCETLLLNGEGALFVYDDDERLIVFHYIIVKCGEMIWSTGGMMVPWWDDGGNNWQAEASLYRQM
ncbi:uncharacterized protein PGTG_22133 [Puccinia graminis f. sp. tritici CRL 75-36-700-3]|uniref:Uncharacterized protein n=1 Tax=Puccinia graminis f. sp. tritici (strain CRL 75-36-700-3 / race SCCL) TaxID=418459 RepID=H6QTJ5_PUCGT|nr:uncharacterized protein PGTG_22133 [Puccinia graminis f. sp. tritici CRL 75-36-700-3]EHS64210.1 hypothetical protein PGTG_22133 [Puccinia graminis f. sp. tritici CRL 75-36-700-3]